MKLIGKGILIDAKRGVPFADYGELLVRFGVDVVSIPRGDIAGKYSIPIGTQITGHIQWFDISGELLAGILGGETTDGSVRFANLEEHTIPDGEPYQITLDSGDNLTNTETVQDGSGLKYRRVEGTPGVSQYSISDNTLTFSSDDAETVVYISYFYQDTDDGLTVNLNPTDIPSHFELVGKLDLVGGEDDGGGELVITAKRCVRVSDMEIGAGVGEFGRFGFDFVIDNSNAGDVVVSMPG